MQANQLLYPQIKKDIAGEIRIEKTLQVVQKTYPSQRREEVDLMGASVNWKTTSLQKKYTGG